MAFLQLQKKDSKQGHLFRSQIFPSPWADQAFFSADCRCVIDLEKKFIVLITHPETNTTSLYTLEVARYTLEDDPNPWSKDKCIAELRSILSCYPAVDYVNVYQFPFFDNATKVMHKSRPAVTLFDPNVADRFSFYIALYVGQFTPHIPQKSYYLTLSKEEVKPLTPTDDLLDLSKICTIPSICNSIYTWGVYMPQSHPNVVRTIADSSATRAKVVQKILDLAQETPIFPYEDFTEEFDKGIAFELFHREDGEICWISISRE